MHKFMLEVMVRFSILWWSHHGNIDESMTIMFILLSAAKPDMKLSYHRWMVQCATSVEILSVAVQTDKKLHFNRLTIGA